MLTPLAELLEAVFPRRCALCGAGAANAPAASGPGCARHALPAPGLEGPRCGRCAARLPDALPGGGRCLDCRRRGPGFARTVAAYDWRAVTELPAWVFALKYGGRADLAEPLGTLLGEALERHLCARRENPGAAPLLTFLPLHPRRRFERGYDQAELLARHAAAALGLRSLATLRRLRATPVQGGPGAVSRAANVRGAFAPRWTGPAGGRGASPARRALRGREVWLVDDVLTSGASASEAARVLKRMGVSSVGVLVLARAGAGGAAGAPEAGGPPALGAVPPTGSFAW